MTSALLADLPVRLVIALGRTVKQAFGELLARLAELAPLAGPHLNWPRELDLADCLPLVAGGHKTWRRPRLTDRH